MPQLVTRRLLSALAILALSVGLPAAAQPPSPESAAAQRAAMAKLDYMTGEWVGEGWMDLGTGRSTFRGSERVQSKLGGIALLVEGDFVGKRPGSEEEVPVHTTLGVIYYDPQAQRYRFDTWLATGGAGGRELTVNADGWQWEIKSPRGMIRYVMKLTPAGEWFEVGERSTDGTTWQKFFEMTLRKKP